jgi:hypothetical protein
MVTVDIRSQLADHGYGLSRVVENAHATRQNTGLP